MSKITESVDKLVITMQFLSIMNTDFTTLDDDTIEMAVNYLMESKIEIPDSTKRKLNEECKKRNLKIAS